MFFYSK